MLGGMTDSDFRVELARVGMTAAAFARLVGRNTSTGARWASGEVPVPGWVPLVFELLRYRQGMIKEAAE